MSNSTTTDKRGAGVTQRPHLRLLRGGRRNSAAAARTDGHDEQHPTPDRSRILVAGADPAQRAAVLRDLSEALPSDTQFGEAGAGWEVLEQAPSSGVVMLTGDLDEVTAESLMHVLGHRYPRLPVVALRAFAGADPAYGGPSARASASASG